MGKLNNCLKPFHLHLDDGQTFTKGTTKTWKTLVFCIVWQYHNFSVILKNPPISGVHSDKRWKQSHNDLHAGPRLQQSTYQKEN